jgi:hypothetical protein
MTHALESYREAHEQAKAIEKDGGVLAEQNGGSGHGSTEVLYRIHASRLKCLIYAVDRPEFEREPAELEALRITEQFWFSPPNDSPLPSGTRDRVWAVLSDVVSALCQCRRERSFFHRSVYRHAQALLWAPFLSDPVNKRAHGSFGSVPATKAVQLRGLNSATNAAESGLVVMMSLFDKKRSQLCAVWVASGSVSTFQTINNSIRKYDSLRGKYISAYLNCLRLARRKTDLETFFQWTMSCRRDLPSYFSVTAVASAREPIRPHIQDSLLVKARSLASYHFLTSTKRLANTAIASIVLQEIDESPSAGVESKLREAFDCFLRLNCSPIDFENSKSWKYQRAPTGLKAIAKAVTHAYVKVTQDQGLLSNSQSDWGGQGQMSQLVHDALAKCKELFPTASSNSLLRKTVTKKARKKSDEVGTKRKEPDGAYTILRSYEVAVPAGLSSADTFLTSIQIGEAWKKIRLTVPEGRPASLRFSLRVPVALDETINNPNDPRPDSSS